MIIGRTSRSDRAGLIRQLHAAARRERARTVQKLLRQLLRRAPKSKTSSPGDITSGAWRAPAAHPAVGTCR